MSAEIKWAAELSHVREVTLLGDADLAYWAERLSGEGLAPLACAGRSRVMIIAAEMVFAGIRFREVSVSVRVVAPGGQSGEGAWLVRAFNSFRLFAFCERTFFSTPYEHADVRVSAAPPASVTVRQGGTTAFAAATGAGVASSAPRDGGWEGPVFLPRGRRQPPDGGRAFFARVRGPTRGFPFRPGHDSVMIRSVRDGDVFQELLDSRFTPTGWEVREDAVHAKSKTYRRAALAAV